MNGNGNRKKRSRLFLYGGIGLAIVLLIAIGVFAATRGGTKIDPSKLAKVEKGDLAKSVVATGKVTPITKVEVKSKASGIVKKLLVDYGDHVKKGQLLAQLDKVEIEAQVAQSKAALEAAEANLKSSEADYERAKVDAQGPDVPLLKRAYDRNVLAGRNPQAEIVKSEFLSPHHGDILKINQRRPQRALLHRFPAYGRYPVQCGVLDCIAHRIDLTS